MARQRRAIWSSPPKNTQVRGVNNFSKCVDTENNAFFIDNNAYADGYGWDTDKFPSLATRKGRTTHGAVGSGVTRLLANFGNIHLVRAVGTSLQYNASGTTWSNIAGTHSDVDYDYTNFDINGAALIILNQTDGGRYWNGTTLSAISQMPKGKFIASDNRRVYVAGKSGEEDSIFYCSFQDALDFTTPSNSGVVQYFTHNGGAITGLHSFEGQVYVFKKDSFAQIFHTGSADVTHRLVECSNDIGCLNYRTISEVGNWLIWLGNKDVFICSGGAAQSIGSAVTGILDKINMNAISEACAWTDDYRYYLCIPTGTNTTCDTEIVYDTRYKTWNVRNINLGGQRWGALINNAPYGGWHNGMTYQLNNGTTDAGAIIPYRVDSKPYDEGVGEAEKEYYEMYLQGYISSGAMMDVKISTVDRGDSFILLDTITSDSVSQNNGIFIPMDTVPLTHWMRYRLEGSGYVEINQNQRYARIQPIHL